MDYLDIDELWNVNELISGKQLYVDEQTIIQAVKAFDCFAEKFRPACLVRLHSHFKLRYDEVAVWTREGSSYKLSAAQKKSSYLPGSWGIYGEQSSIVDFIEPETADERRYLQALYSLCAKIDIGPLSKWMHSHNLKSNSFGISIAPYFFCRGRIEDLDKYIFVEQEIENEARSITRTQLNLHLGWPYNFVGSTTIWRPGVNGWIQASGCSCKDEPDKP